MIKLLLLTLLAWPDAPDGGYPDAGGEVVRWYRQCHMEPEPSWMGYYSCDCHDAGTPLTHVWCDGGLYPGDQGTFWMRPDQTKYVNEPCTFDDGGIEWFEVCLSFCGDPLPDQKVCVDQDQCLGDAGWRNCL